ncbi:MAG TPA: type II toxin-antitoxin system VapC family toxin [Candidatus Acidoferrum sp.]|jgi:PIN domain nuclease of toxin-antitoxin system|nr:type II toxin-antitoxin system VapC family toxin [Candidatus Acidoferrum sp.]
MERVLADTHAFVWWIEGREQLSYQVREILENPETTIYISAASAWELAIKARIGKFKSSALVSGFSAELEKEGFLELPISIKHAVRAGMIKAAHKDPFDRMLAAQAQLEGLPILSNDKIFDKLSVRRIW